MMEVSRRRVRNLEPARPLRRLNVNEDGLDLPALHEHFEPEMDEAAEPYKNSGGKNSVNTVTVEQFYEILNLHNQSQAPAKTERISYSRDFLIKLASSPMAKKKPDFLPEHPVVLEKARDQDVHKLFVNNFSNKLDLKSSDQNLEEEWRDTQSKLLEV
ncbi:hypothetical protein AMEX_G8320 [Astyanax mexicanus]|uniref:Uncharacterized protein n=3 Tax=Astyanax mexicanus TaxID=7994 RepID=A0A8T2LVV1_ASTMX|nr:hypothetical protein AMEX_G8320 [Astyanax mexicanus]